MKASEREGGKERATEKIRGEIQKWNRRSRGEDSEGGDWTLNSSAQRCAFMCLQTAWLSSQCILCTYSYTAKTYRIHRVVHPCFYSFPPFAILLFIYFFYSGTFPVLWKL